MDASSADRAAAASVCAVCPARQACEQLRLQVGPSASGTWAGAYYAWTDENYSDEVLVAFTAVFGIKFDHASAPQAQDQGHVSLRELTV